MHLKYLFHMSHSAPKKKVKQKLKNLQNNSRTNIPASYQNMHDAAVQYISKLQHLQKLLLSYQPAELDWTRRSYNMTSARLCFWNYEIMKGSQTSNVVCNYRTEKYVLQSIKKRSLNSCHMFMMHIAYQKKEKGVEYTFKERHASWCNCADSWIR